MNIAWKIAEISGPVTKSQQQSLQNPIILTKHHRNKVENISSQYVNQIQIDSQYTTSQSYLSDLIKPSLFTKRLSFIFVLLCFIILTIS